MNLKEARAIVFARSGGLCEFRLDGCTGRATEAHHRRRRQYDPLHATLAAVCGHCHRTAHANPADSYKAGLLLHNFDASGDDPWTPPRERVHPPHQPTDFTDFVW